MEAAQACDYVIELATTRIAAIDFTAKQRAAYRAKQRPKSPVTAARHNSRDHRSDCDGHRHGRAHDAGGACAYARP